MKNHLFTLLIFLPLIGTAQSRELTCLKKRMSGSFSSERQHRADTANYFDIRLTMTPIWKGSPDGFWLYVEQAVAGSLDKPYRQRVYHVTEPQPGTFQSAIYTLTEPLRFAGHPEHVEALSRDSLKLKDGCDVVLRREGKDFVGGTVGKNCPSDRKGAAYATSKVTIHRKAMVSWDQGFNDKDEQVWGAEKGGYIFRKR